LNFKLQTSNFQPSLTLRLAGKLQTSNFKLQTLNSPQYPPPFLSRMKLQLGDEFDAFMEAHQKPAPVSVRVNPFKPVDVFNEFEKVPWAKNAFYLPERISFTLDPLFHAGCYYVQEASSMFLEQVLGFAFADGKSCRVLDLCASPGGKSTHVVSLLPEESLLVSNEVVPSRNNILRQNLSRWGTANVVVTQNDAADFNRLPQFFDVMIVDAPCSGEGLFRKNPGAMSEWSVEQAAFCAKRQTDIFDDVVNTLRPGGYLIYSTCTYNRDENDQVCEHLIQQHNFEHILLDASFEGIVKTKFGCGFYPHRIKGEGFYISLLKKRGEVTPQNYSRMKLKLVDKQNLSRWLNTLDAHMAFQKDQDIYLIPDFISDELPVLMKNLFVRKAGIHLGSLSGSELNPSHELAFANSIDARFPSIKLSRQDSLRYLKGEALVVADPVKGWHQILYENQKLGWAKGAGKRLNNHYPKELRIIRDLDVNAD
jgi:16S rRNA C967 or C1407 C5-methylase (RsmB/RsmF family)/NOL1/NOP2/fmu family ribosome biogenesis protein